jgi:hypothetical protein
MVKYLLLSIDGSCHPEARVRFLELPRFLSSSGYGTQSTQPREYMAAAIYRRQKVLSRVLLD